MKQIRKIFNKRFFDIDVQSYLLAFGFGLLMGVLILERISQCK